MAVVCPECDNPIVVEEEALEEGELLECEECGAELEVTGLDPVQLAVAESGYVEEDTAPTRGEDEE